MSGFTVDSSSAKLENKWWSEHIDQKILDRIWGSAVAHTPPFIDSANEQPLHNGKIHIPSGTSKGTSFPERISGNWGKLKPTGSRPNVKIFNNGVSADFVLGKTKIIFDQKTGSVAFLGANGKPKTFTSISDLPFTTIEDQTDLTAGKSVKIPINKNGAELTLQIAKDGIHFDKAFVTWSDRSYDKNSLVFRTAYIENKITVDNLMGGGNLKVTPKQYYVPIQNIRYVNY